MTDQDKRSQMRALAIEAHTGQQRNAGRVPYVVHVLSVGEILREALELTGECRDPELARDIYLAALGHDLYEDTSVSVEHVRRHFGTRVDGMIEGMTNRAGDDNRTAYEARMAGAEDEVRLIKIADLIDNVVSCAYGIHDLGVTWVRDSFYAMARRMSSSVATASYAQFPATAKLMLGWLEFGLARLQVNITIAEALEEPTTAEAAHEELATLDGQLDLPDDAVEKYQGRERRTGWLLKGMRVFTDK
jgi:hypothetical protein